MMISFRAILIVLILAGCGGTSSSPPETPDASDAAPRGLLIPLDLPTVSAQELSLIFPDNAVAMLLAYQERFIAVQDESDLRAVYAEALSLDQMILGDLSDAAAEDDGTLLAEFAQSDLLLPGLSPTCVAECTEPALALDMADWRAAARHIGSAEAEDYFALLDAFYTSATLYDGDIQAWPAYFERTWDYGGFSLLGSGLHSSLLTRIDALSAGETLFAPYVDRLRTLLVNDATVQACLGPSASEARAELERLATSPSLSDGERIRLQERAAALQDPETFGVEHGCASPAAQCNCSNG